MKIKEFKAPILIFDNLPDKKEEILKAIDSMGSHSLIERGQQISNTDWHLQRDYLRPYYDIVQPIIEQCLSEANKKMGSNIIDIGNYWFQQYNTGDFHEWHNHGMSTFSSVYYVELPKSTSTTFRYMGDEFQVDVKEGNYIIFPSYLRHCSKINKTKQRKTVIALNINMH